MPQAAISAVNVLADRGSSRSDSANATRASPSLAFACRHVPRSCRKSARSSCGVIDVGVQKKIDPDELAEVDAMMTWSSRSPTICG